MLEKIAAVLKEYKGDDDLVITENTPFSELELDSLDMVELIMNLEDAFEVTIEVKQKIATIQDLMKIIENAQ